MLRAILNKSWRQHPTRHQLYGHLPPITKNIQVRRTRQAGHCWRSRDELISDGRAKAGRPARTYIQQLCEDTGCCPEDLPEAMNDKEKWRERVRDIRATSTTWYIYIYNIYIYIYIYIYIRKQKVYWSIRFACFPKYLPSLILSPKINLHYRGDGCDNLFRDSECVILHHFVFVFVCLFI